MSKRFLLIIEIVWIITGLLCLAAGIRYAITTGGNKIFIFAILSLISFLFAWLRHRERKKV